MISLCELKRRSLAPLLFCKAISIQLNKVLNVKKESSVYKSLQSGRAIAAILVLLFHLGLTIASDKYFAIEGFAIPFSFGDSGVEFFFVLSGFIIYHVHKDDIGRPGELGVYLYKRITRIYPVYLIIFTGVYSLAILSPQLRNSVPHDVFLIIKSLLLIPQNKDVVGGTGAPVLIVAWTLQFEIMFYAAFAVGVMNKRLGQFLIALFIGGSLLGMGAYGFPFSFILNEHVWLFLMGMLVAKLSSIEMKSSIYPSLFAVIGGAIYLVTALDIVVGETALKSIQTIIYGIACSFIVLAMIAYEKQGKILLKNNFYQLLGASSYSLYLIHYPLISILCKVSVLVGLKDLGLAGALLAYIIIFILCILVSIFFHLLIEKPVAKKLKVFIKEPNAQSLKKTI